MEPHLRKGVKCTRYTSLEKYGFVVETFFSVRKLLPRDGSTISPYTESHLVNFSWTDLMVFNWVSSPFFLGRSKSNFRLKSEFFNAELYRFKALLAFLPPFQDSTSVLSGCRINFQIATPSQLWDIWRGQLTDIIITIIINPVRGKRENKFKCDFELRSFQVLYSQIHFVSRIFFFNRSVSLLTLRLNESGYRAVS